MGLGSELRTIQNAAKRVENAMTGAPSQDDIVRRSLSTPVSPLLTLTASIESSPSSFG